MKIIIVTLFLTFSLVACAHKLDTTQKEPHGYFFKKGVSDKQLTNDLNACAYEAFKSSIESNDAAFPFAKIVTQQSCMHLKHYELFYN
jgi:predicted transcriptional regulator